MLSVCLLSDRWVPCVWRVCLPCPMCPLPQELFFGVKPLLVIECCSCWVLPDSLCWYFPDGSDICVNECFLVICDCVCGLTWWVGIYFLLSLRKDFVQDCCAGSFLNVSENSPVNPSVFYFCYTDFHLFPFICFLIWTCFIFFSRSVEIKKRHDVHM